MNTFTQICTGLVTGALTATLATAALTHTPENTPKMYSDNFDIVVYEDGSGVQYDGDQEVRTWPADTFVWTCEYMGNHICGPTAR